MIDAMKQALERLTMWLEDSPDTAVIEDHWAVDALRQAIAEAEKQAEFDKEFAIYAESDEGKARSKQAEKEATLQEISDIGREIEQVTIKQGWDVDSLLSKPKQEPVAWKCECGANLFIDEAGNPCSKAPPKREWVSLSTDDIYRAADREHQSTGFVHGALWAEAALLEKNNGN
jgi:hypothetical protein